jgi:CheY-like chemotaxis protein
MDAFGQLTGGMAHDFNNLLTIIIGNLELLKLKLKDNEAVSRVLDRALNGALRGAGLTRQLLGFARRQSLAPQDFDASELVTTTFDLMRRTLGEQITVVTALAPSLWPIYADPAQVEAALTNLAINARDAMPKGGRIAVEAANRTVEDDFEVRQAGLAPGDYVMLSVSDTGTGIAPDVLPRVFEPFFTTKAHGKGTGLGLSMVFGFVRQSHGHIEIESELGRGTTVRIYLPRGREAAAAMERVAEDRRPAPIAGARVLIVEDNAGVRETVVARLRDLGCTVSEADCGALALEVIERDRAIDLLFTDIVMPGGMSGIELADAAKRNWPNLPVLFTSGFYDDHEESSRRIGELGSLLRKPYTAAELEQRLRAALAAGHKGGRGVTQPLCRVA